MSVSALDHAVSNPPPRTPPPKAEHPRNAPAPSPIGEQKAGRINFNSGDTHTTQLFASQAPASQSRTEGRTSQANSGQFGANDAHGPFGQLKQKLKGWCGGQRPPKPDPCQPPPCNGKPPKPPKPCKPKPDPCKPDPCNSKPPVRPDPCKPDPYPCKSNENLLEMLKGAFESFKTPGSGQFINKETIRDFAQKDPAMHPGQRHLIHLAQALDSREGLLDAIDRYSTTGALDNLIDMRKIQMTLDDPSPLKYYSDQQLAGEMLEHFRGLSNREHPGYINTNKLREIAKWPTGDEGRGRLAWIAQEVIKRSETEKQMDGGDNCWGTDGWIHKSTLEQMFK